MRILALTALLLFLPHPSSAQVPTFDLHVHLRNGAESIDEYEAQVASAKRQVTAFGGMWFGGPRQALQGDKEHTRAQNDALIALASKAGALGVVVLMDNANIIAGDSEHLFNLAIRAPKTKFVFAHMGGMNFRFWNILAAARTAKDFFMDNIYFDISGTVVLAADSPIEEEFVWTLHNVGIDQVILGQSARIIASTVFASLSHSNILSIHGSGRMVERVASAAERYETRS